MASTQSFHERRLNGFHISTDPSLLDLGVVHCFLSKESYWAEGSSQQELKNFVAESLCFGVYQADQQVGFASVMTDFTSFAYLSDVFILEKYRGQGLAKWLMETVTSHPELQSGIDWMLTTEDAQGLYEQVGFSSISKGSEQMEKRSSK